MLPKIGPIFSTLDALITGGKKNKTQTTAQAGVGVNSSFQGTLKLDSDNKPISFFTPGSPYKTLSNPDATKFPVYDHVLGIFNLIDLPVLSYTTYQPYEQWASSYTCLQGNGAGEKYFVLPPIRQYHLKKPPVIAINPASELELVDLDIAIQYQLGPNHAKIAVDTLHQIGVVGPNPGNLATHRLGLYGPVAIGEPLGSDYPARTYPERLRSYGIDIANWPKTDSLINDVSNLIYTTGFFPATCADKQSVFLAVPDSNTTYFQGYGYEPKFTLKVRAVLRRTDAEADADTEDVIFMANYKVKIEEVPGGTTYYIHDYSPTNPNQQVCQYHLKSLYMNHYAVKSLSSTKGAIPFFPKGNNGLPFDLVLENQPISNSTYALNTIELKNIYLNSDSLYLDSLTGNLQTTKGQPIVIQAGQEVIMHGGSNGNSIGEPEAMISSGLPEIHFEGCDQLHHSSLIADWNAISNFCTDINRYNPNIGNRDMNPTPTLPPLALSVFPNPASQAFIARIIIPETRKINLELYDSSGRLMDIPYQDFTLGAGKKELKVDTSRLTPGLYIVVLKTPQQLKSVKIIVE